MIKLCYKWPRVSPLSEQDRPEKAPGRGGREDTLQVTAQGVSIHEHGYGQVVQ